MNIIFKSGHTDFNRTGEKHHEHPRLSRILRFKAARGPAEHVLFKKRTGLHFPPSGFGEAVSPRQLLLLFMLKIS